MCLASLVTETEYKEALRDRAEHLYCVLMMDPLKVPLLNPNNADVYPSEISSEIQMDFWLTLTEELQIIKPE